MSAEVAKAAGARVAISGIAHDRDNRLRVAAEQGFMTIKVSPENSLTSQLAAGITDAGGIPFGSNGKVDVLIESSGVSSIVSEAINVVRPKGDICIIATYGKEASKVFNRQREILLDFWWSSFKKYD